MDELIVMTSVTNRGGPCRVMLEATEAGLMRVVLLDDAVISMLARFTRTVKGPSFEMPRESTRRSAQATRCKSIVDPS